MLTEWRKTTAVEKVLYGLMFLSLAFLFWLDSHYFSICPRVPDSRSGHIYPLDNRGTFVYLTEAENSKMLAAESLFFVTWLGAVGFYVVTRGLKKLKVR
jgi:hypothetical protein